MSSNPQSGQGSALIRQVRLYGRLMRFDKPVGIWLLMWPTLWALWLSTAGRPDGGVFIVFMCGVVVMRAAGCVINDIADRDFDPHITRTRDRPLAAGQVTLEEALTLFCALGLIAVGLAAMLNTQARWLAVIGAALTVIYPFMKRVLSIPQLFLGAAFGWAVPMAFVAQTGELPQLAWLVFAVTLIWATIYDTYYSMADRPEDLRIGVKSTAILFGDADRFIVGGLQVLMLAGLALIGDMAALGPWYFASVALAAMLMGYHQWLTRKREPEACFDAFLKNHYVGMIVFIGIVLHYTFSAA